jgi:hypothetical protein
MKDNEAREKLQNHGQQAHDNMDGTSRSFVRKKRGVSYVQVMRLYPVIGESKDRESV